MTDGLTEAAKQEIKAAIAIIREDRFEKFVREHSTKKVDSPAKEVEEKEDELLKKDDGVTPPPVKEKEKEIEEDAPKGKRSAYWGEIFE